jgi:hypothetical protein
MTLLYMFYYQAKLQEEKGIQSLNKKQMSFKQVIDGADVKERENKNRVQNSTSETNRSDYAENEGRNIYYLPDCEKDSKD